MLISHMILTDNCYVLASSGTMLLDMAQSATDKIIQCELEWKTNDIQNACCVSALDKRDLEFTMNDCQRQKFQGCTEMLVMGSLLSNKADTMSTMRHPHEQSNVSNEGRKCTSTRMLTFLKEGSTRDTSRLYRPARCTRLKHGAVRRSW